MSSKLPSPSSLDEMSPMAPEIQGAVKKIGLSSPQATAPEALIHELRQTWAKMPIPPPQPRVVEQTSSYTARDGTDLCLCIYKPAAVTSEGLPVVVWYHGGGMCMGFPELNASMLRSVSLRHNCVVVAPQYRLGPESKFPTGVEDCWDALVYVASHASDFGAHPARGFVVGGESAGAVISAVLSLQAWDQNLQPALTGSFLSAGSYFNPEDIPEQYKEHYRSRFDPVCRESPFLSEKTKTAIDACLVPDYSSPQYRAALWPSGHAGLPKSYIQTCGNDINRDDGILYCDLLQQSDVTTRLDVYPGCPHCFWFLLIDTSLGRRWEADMQTGFEWLLTTDA